MTCRDLEDQITEYLEGALAPPGRIDFETYLAACPECRKRLNEMHDLIETSHDLGGKIKLDCRHLKKGDYILAIRKDTGQEWEQYPLIIP